jgi:membrane fusion protein, adhesin transport system
MNSQDIVTEYARKVKVIGLRFSAKFVRWIYGFLFLFVLLLLCPWTQNVSADGRVTALLPEQRPQTIHSGRIEKWYVEEGQKVKKGDTILFISETDKDYFDPNLLKNTQEQVKSKENSVLSYQNKVNALNKQIDALNQTMDLKIEQTKNKIRQAELKISVDSTDFVLAVNNFSLAQDQFKRYEELLQKGIVSQTEFEQRKLKLQEAQAKRNNAENKLLTSRNEYTNAVIELNSIKAEYNDKLMKAQAEKYTALSLMFESEASVALLQSQYAKYENRVGFYYVTAPQDGYITRALSTGMGEIIKEGTPIVSIMPSDFKLSVEWYVAPIDIPLLSTGKKVRFVFDGWPSLVFSGWPGLSVGTYGGEIVAIDNIADSRGLFRVLVAEDKDEQPWPSQLRPGGGARGFALLEDVPLWFEIWRRLNGFPPRFYQNDNEKNP